MKIDSNIVKEIQSIKIRGEMTFQEVYNKFYKILKKHKIFQWKKSGKGSHHGNSPEFIMCLGVFKQSLENQIMFLTFMGGNDKFNVPDYMWEGGRNAT